MKRKISVGMLIRRLNKKILGQLDITKSLILGVVLKGLPVAYGIARVNRALDNFVPVVAHRPLQLQHHVNSYFPSPEWKSYLQERLKHCESLIIVDDVVNSGFTKQRLESIAVSLTKGYRVKRWFAALVLNRKNLASPRFVDSRDLFALQVNAKEVECDWGTITVPLWDLPIDEARQVCEEYFRKHWLNERRFVTITY
jgi:orotate phosphoribosyltransferase